VPVGVDEAMVGVGEDAGAELHALITSIKAKMVNTAVMLVV
jgi:hypothetical protein